MMKFEYRDSRLLRLRDFLSSSLLVAVLLGLTLAAVWLLDPTSLLGSSAPAPAGTAISADVGVVSDGPIDELLPGMRLIENFQVSQPRDPFRPLITEDTGGTGNGGDPFDPTGTTVSLQSVTTLPDGSFQAVVRVAGTDYTVGAGDTFAGSYQVVTLTATGGTFLFGDSPFTLAVGEEILK